VANEPYAFLARDRVPSRDQWQDAIQRAGFDFVLDPKLVPFEDSGFAPCKLHGRDAGFEIYYEDDAEVLAEFEEVLGGRD